MYERLGAPIGRMAVADFCMQCSRDLFGENNEDLADIAPIGGQAWVLCEGCGPTKVNEHGRCVNPYCPKHGAGTHELGQG